MKFKEQFKDEKKKRHLHKLWGWGGGREKLCFVKQENMEHLETFKEIGFWFTGILK